MSRQDLFDLLKRYTKQETTPEENLKVEQWLDAQQLKEDPWKNTDQEEWLKTLKVRIDRSLAEPVHVPVRRIGWRTITSIAAILLVLLGIWWLNRPINDAALIVATTTTSQKTITLADGSVIWLNKDSKLSYPDEFRGNTREVYLEGEAYFDIRHDAQKAFMVHTGKLLTTVVGTAFNILAGHADSSITVTVTRGKVKVSQSDTLLDYITPNQQLSYSVPKKDFKKEVVDATDAVAWKSGELLFDDITFGEAAEILEQRFKVDIRFAKSEIKNCRFTGTAVSGKNLDEILKVICAFNHANYTRNKDGSILIDGQGCR